MMTLRAWMIGFATAWIVVLANLSSGLRAAEQIPPAPENHFNDYARIVDPSAAQRLNTELAQFERDTSNQIVVAIYPKLQSDSSVADYSTRVAQKWGVGAKGRSNGAVLFIFQESHDIWIATGYGLEGALPDALCKRIIENEIVPAFRRGDFTGGVTAGVHAIMAAAKGEYAGTGQTNRERGERAAPGRGGFGIFIFIFVVFVLLQHFVRSRRNVLYNPRGRRGIWMGPGGGWGGGWGGGGGWSGGGGGGGTFSGGGGSFGGGGAGGKW